MQLEAWMNKMASAVIVMLAAVAPLSGCPSGKRETVTTRDATPVPTSDKTQPGARVRFTAGDRKGETGVVRGRTPGVPHELYDILVDGSGDLVSSAPDRFELTN